MTKVILSGSKGFLGGYIKNEIDNSDLIIFDRSNILSFDISNLIAKSESYIFIHCAGLAHDTFEKKSKGDYYESNVLLTKNILKRLISHPPISFVYISSVAVYGLDQGILINEETPLLATDDYGKSKVLAEKEVKIWCDKLGVKYCILRLPLVVGTNPPGNLKSMIIGIKNNYYFNINGGGSRRSMVMAEDVAKIIIKAADVGGIYNLTDSYHPSYRELSYHICRLLDSKLVLNMPFFMAWILAKIGDLFGKYLRFNSATLNKLTSSLTFDDLNAKVKLEWSPNKVLENWKI